ncbi:hypothetical protein SAMN05443572_102873 [Myxococcus fulvus]|uniref:Lipoprotein n=1 Tax=Myxococcus fulvus TaxID=33 RepID=A0A511SVT3_MYXFU|nr:hypothetical protein [Myxococcus fulvus]GEN06009.1 hypothetical protein MFU01_10460 [Myxococcus fulvus]SET60937.1 hypothetical protein SAMN05443572_102873 [Myxococcus fulvus]
MTRKLCAVIAACAVLTACSDDDKKPSGSQQDGGPLSTQGLTPSALERPPTSGGLPADLKPPGR